MSLNGLINRQLIKKPSKYGKITIFLQYYVKKTIFFNII